MSLLLAFLLVLCSVAANAAGLTGEKEADWPLLRLGSNGANAFSLQDLLNYRGYEAPIDGLFGYSTETEVEAFQRNNGLTADGLVGTNTWAALCPLLSEGNRHSGVTAFQRQLNKHGYNLALNGIYDSVMRTAVISFQNSYGLTPDGLVGPNTWREGLGNANEVIDPEYEFRGAWVASVSNIDWPSRTGLSSAAQQAELIEILDTLVDLRMNAMVLQIRPEGDAFYPSTIGEPWSRFLSGTQGVAPNPYYDPLEFAITEAHRRGIELHAWYNPYRAAVSLTSPMSSTHMCIQISKYCYVYGTNKWMDPGSAEVQNRTYEAIMDVVRRYDVDAIHFDDYFYSYPVEGEEFPDASTYLAYRNSGGTLSLDDWRRNNVNVLIERVYNGIHAIKSYVKFGISPFGIYRPGIPPGIVGFDQYGDLYADPKLWLEKGWVDYLAPQLYWRIDPPQQSYLTLNDWWVSINILNRHVYPGNYLSMLDGTNWPLNEYERQVSLTRWMGRGSLGNIFFSMQVFLNNKLGVNEYFKANIYKRAAKMPVMEWLPKKNYTAEF